MTSRSYLACATAAAISLAALAVTCQPGKAQDLEKLLQAAKPGSNPPAKPVAQLAGFSNWVTSLAWSPDGVTLAAGTYDEVKLFDAKTRKEQKSLAIKGYVRGLAYSPDGKSLAAGGYQVVTLWETGAYAAARQLTGHRGYVTGVSFSPDGKQIATSSEDESIRVWNVEDGTETLAIRGHSYPVMDVAFSPDGKLLASVAGDETRVTRPGEVKIWDAASGEEKFNLVEHEKAATSVAFSADGKYLASTGEDEKVNLYDVATGKPLGYFNGHGRPTNDVLFLSGGETLVSAAGGRAQGKYDVKVWNRADGDEWATFSAHKGQVDCLALSPDGKTLASGGYDEIVLLWDLAAAIAKPAAAAADNPVVAPVP